MNDRIGSRHWLIW